MRNATTPDIGASLRLITRKFGPTEL